MKESTPPLPRLRGRLLEIGAALLLATALVALGVWRRTGDTGIARVGDDQVAVVVDRRSGNSRIVAHPGYVFFVPLLQKVHLFDRSPRALRMEGSRPRAPDLVPQLLARAKDGSSFWFTSIEIQYVLAPERTAQVLDDVPPGTFVEPELLSAAARSVLRDELGRWNSEEIARGECNSTVASAAVSRLNSMLRLRGVEVLGISLGKPGFDDAYEDAIRRRATFLQEAEQLETKLAGMQTDKGQKEAGVRKDKEVEMRKLEGILIRDLGVARAEDIRIRQDADDAFRSEVQAGTASKREKEAQAALVKARHVAAARAVYREGLDLERSGELPVRAALVKKLAGIQFDLVPYSRDAAPRRLEYEELQTGKGKP